MLSIFREKTSQNKIPIFRITYATPRLLTKRNNDNIKLQEESESPDYIYLGQDFRQK